MMRRARWLAAGAVLGALGYQRLHRATRSLTSQSESVSAARQAVGVVRFGASAAGHVAGVAGWLARQARRRRAAGFISDVREGMDDYLDRHQANMNRQYRHSGNTLVGQRAPSWAAIPGSPSGHVGAPVPPRQDDKTKDGR
ncbi:MAG TPA: hypothetical protein VEV63_03470 [Streptosporangiaceae bacterium]|nr:hypothetical protein [Streptosporangiaceae bacterium]